MKKILLLCLLALFAAMTFLFTACEEKSQDVNTPPSGSQTQTESDLQTFTGISFQNETLTYDGKEHKIEVTGTLPEGSEVIYQNNSGTNAGTYNATATVSKENYETLELTATLTIAKATFTGITLENETVMFDGKEHSLTVKGTLPEGTTVRYENNAKTESGEYKVKAFVENANYNTLELEATLYIRSLLDAKSIIDTILTRPDAWSFMPEAFLPENMAYSALPQNEFSEFVSVNNIGKRSIGKQMNVVYDALTQTQSILSKADIVFAAGESIAAVYQTFINDHPNDYTEFVGSVTIGGMTLSAKISLLEKESVLLLGNDTMSIELRADSESNINIGRIQIAGAVLKYESGEHSMQLALQFEAGGVEIAQTLEFVREGNVVTGYLYEYYGVGSAAIKTTSLVTSNESLTIITGDKRESDDLLIEAYEEVYNTQTGEMIGAEVSETVKLADFDTLWIPLDAVQGFNTVKVADAQNNLNADTVYVNGSASPFETKKIGGFGLDTASRRYDIEMKEVWYIVATESEGSTTYSSEKVLIPMLFVQTKVLDDFADDVCSANDTVENIVLPDTSAITEYFVTMKETYLDLKELVSYTEIDAFIGENDPFFSEQ